MKKIFALCMTAVMIVSSLCGCEKLKSDWVISVDGSKVYKDEYMVYLYEQVKAFEEKGGSDIWDIDFDGVSATEVAKQNAANSLLRAKLAVKEAPSLGVSTVVDETTLNTEAKALYDSITSDDIKRIPLENVTLDTCKNIISDGLVQKDVYDAVTGSYEINRQEFDDYLNSYYQDNIHLYKNMIIKAIYISEDPNADPPDGEAPTIDEFSTTIKKDIQLKGKERMDEAYALLQDGERFAQVQYDYSEDPNRREFKLTDDMFNEEVRAKIYALKQGQYTDIISYNGVLYVFYAKEVSQTDIEDIRHDTEEQYIAEKKEEVYQAQNDIWLNSSEIKRNTSVWESIKINTAITDEPLTAGSVDAIETAKITEAANDQ